MSNAVPDGWSNPILGKVFSLLRGSVIPNENPNEKFDYYSLPIFDQTGSSATVLGSEIESNKTLITEQAILVSKLNPRKPRVQLVKEAAGLRRCASTEFMAYAPNTSGVSLPFYKYYFLSEYFSGRLQLVATGSTNSHVRVTPGETLRWSIPQPPLPEQQKIAAILSSVDDVIEKTRAQIDKLKDLKTGMMQELLTKGIGHTAFKDSPVGRIPEGWDCRPLKSICARITDGTHQAVKTSTNGQIPFLYVSCIRDGKIHWDKAASLTEADYEIVSRGRIASPGDILYTAVGSYGHAAMVESDQKFSFQRHIAFIQPENDFINSEFLALFLNSLIGREQADKYAIGNAQLTVTLGDLGKFMVPIPSAAEQKKIASALKAIVARSRKVQAKLVALEATKKALMQDLLTGKVRVNVDNKENAVA